MYLFSLILCILYHLVKGQSELCILEPYQASCSNYELSSASVRANVESLCIEMDFMSGCGLRMLCQDPINSLGSSLYCSDFALLAELCSDMPSMTGCANYTSMCQQGTVVQQCSTQRANVPGTLSLAGMLENLCSQHAMEGCERWFNCSNSLVGCELLDIYSEVCRGMPTMSDCADWSEFCADRLADWPLCTVSDARDVVPIMRMYFHTGISDYVLFKDWVPYNQLTYMLTFIAVFSLGVLYEALRVWKLYFERALAATLTHTTAPDWAEFRAKNKRRGYRCSKLTVGGMTCNSCADTVRSSLLELPQVTDVVVLQLRSLAFVASSKKPKRSLLTETIEALGYTVGEASTTSIAETPSKSSCAMCAKRVDSFPHFVKSHPLRWRRDVVRSLLTMLEVTLSFCLMLIAMTFNVGLFVAVVLGAGAGSFLLSGRILSPTDSSGCH